MLVWIAIIFGAVLLDQVSKLLVVRFLDPRESFEIIRGVFRFTYVENDGAAFGMLDDHRWVFMVLSTLGIVALAFYMWKFAPKSRLACVAVSFIIGGGIGNMIDRVRLGYVIDFIDFCAFPTLWKWIFNIADSFVCIGAGLLIFYLVLDIIKESKDKENADDGEKENENA